MKTVFSTSQCVHVWAAQTQREGRNSGRSVFFDGRVIYSYGLHFPMAAFVEHNGQRAVMINTDSYSVTTSRHQSKVRGSVRHIAKQFYVPARAWSDHSGVMAHYVGLIDAYIVKAARARLATVKASHIESAEQTVAAANDYIEFFALDYQPLRMPADVAEHAKIIKECARVAQERAAAAAAERDALRAAEREGFAKQAREDLNAWRNGEPLRLSHYARDLPVALRINGDSIETSHGAEVPLDIAPMLWRAIVRCVETRTDYVPDSADGVRIGHFTLDRIAASGDVTIGCHSIAYAELARVAALLNYYIPQQVTA